MSSKRFWVALYDPSPIIHSDWLWGGEEEARERWPKAKRLVDCTDMADSEFDAMVIEHTNSKARGKA